jgi:hypothetical protein
MTPGMTFGTALRRTVATLAVLVVVAAAFAAGFVVAGARHGETPSYRLTGAGLSGLTCERLRQWYVDHAVDQVTAWGWQSPLRMVPLAGVAENAEGAEPDVAGAPLDTRTGSDTGTNVQEAGVDEPDIVKVSGDLLVRINGGSLETVDVSGNEPHRLGVVPLDRIGDPQLLLSGHRVVVIGSALPDPTAGAPLVAPQPQTSVRTYDLGDPSHPTLVDSRRYGGSLVTARQVGSVIRLVLDGGLPALDFTRPSSTVSENQALEHNRQVVRDSTVDEWLPQVTTDVAGQPLSTPLVDCAGLAVPDSFNGLGNLTIVGFDPASPDHLDATAVATASEVAYLSPTHLYVATSPWAQQLRGFGPPVMPMNATEPTRVYGFDLSGTSARYVGMGSVDGTIAGSWSMNEHDGVLRVAVGSDSGTPATSVVMLRPESGRLVEVGRLGGLGVGQELKSVRWFDDLAVLVTYRQTDPFYVLDVSDPTEPRVLGALHLPGWSSYLHPVGPHLVLGLGQTAPGEIRVDPPQPMPSLPVTPGPSPVPPASIAPTPMPKGEGSVTASPMPKGGDSATASPMPKGGDSVTASPIPVDPPVWGPITGQQHAKATLFDVSDPAHPRDLDTVAYPAGSVPLAGVDPHAVTWLPDRGVLLTVLSGSGLWPGTMPQAPQPDRPNQPMPPIQPGQSAQSTRPVPPAWVSVLTVHDDGLSNRMVPVATTSDVHEIRTVPLSDGRVVLVAGDSVSFLAM